MKAARERLERQEAEEGGEAEALDESNVSSELPTVSGIESRLEAELSLVSNNKSWSAKLVQPFRNERTLLGTAYFRTPKFNL